MCFAKPPAPKPAPPPPDRNAASFAAVEEQRRQSAGNVGRRDTILTRLSDEDVAGSSAKKKLGS